MPERVPDRMSEYIYIYNILPDDKTMTERPFFLPTFPIVRRLCAECETFWFLTTSAFLPTDVAAVVASFASSLPPAPLWYNYLIFRGASWSRIGILNCPLQPHQIGGLWFFPFPILFALKCAYTISQ